MRTLFIAIPLILLLGACNNNRGSYAATPTVETGAAVTPGAYATPSGGAMGATGSAR